jgi:nitrite reductase/ring-hydroxylating ferredoxin subunit
VGTRHYLTPDAYTHGPGSLVEDDMDSEKVEYPLHQRRFHIPSGRPTAPPCTTPLRVWPARVMAGRICIERECNDAAE